MVLAAFALSPAAQALAQQFMLHHLATGVDEALQQVQVGVAEVDACAVGRLQLARAPVQGPACGAAATARRCTARTASTTCSNCTGLARYMSAPTSTTSRKTCGDSLPDTTTTPALLRLRSTEMRSSPLMPGSMRSTT